MIPRGTVYDIFPDDESFGVKRELYVMKQKRLECPDGLVIKTFVNNVINTTSIKRKNNDTKR